MASRTEWAKRAGRSSSWCRKATRLAIYHRDGFCCAYCSATAETSGVALQLDHLVCQTRGGSNASTNLVTACKRCNAARSDKTLAGFAAYAMAAWNLTIDVRAIRARARRKLDRAEGRRLAALRTAG